MVTKVLSWWQEFVSTNTQGALPHGHNLGPTKWTTPPSGLPKINFDGAWSGDNKLGGVGIIVRDGASIFVVAAEALVARECVVCASTRGFKNLLIKGDSLQIVGVLADLSPNRLSLGQIVEDTEALLPLITEDLCSQIRHQANTVVHRLVHFSLSIGSHCEWLLSPPNFILDCL